MKKFTALILIIVVITGILPFYTEAAELVGEGTAASPFLVSNAEQLRYIADFPDAYWELTNDIELSGTWQPIPRFSGVLNGNGYTISGLYFLNNHDIYAVNDYAFIIMNEGAIKRLKLKGTIEKTNFTNYSSGSTFLAYTNNGLIEECSTEGQIDVHFLYVSGATVGYVHAFDAGFVKTNEIDGIIRNCYSLIDFNYLPLKSSTLTITTKKAAYGFCRENLGSIVNCYAATQNITDVKGEIGGFCGDYTDGTFENCFYDKDLKGIVQTTKDLLTEYGFGPKSTFAMKMKATYSAWDMTNVWGLDETINDGYPHLRCEKNPYVKVMGLSLNKSSVNIGIDESVRLTPVFSPANATNKNVTWKTNAKYVATVTADGVVTGFGEGTATITATSEDGGHTATCTVTVSGEVVDPTVYVTGVTLNKTSASLTVDNTLSLTATVSPSNATNKSVSWSSSNASVATVLNGVVTAKSAGTTTITVTTADGGKTATCTVTVTAAAIANKCGDNLYWEYNNHVLTISGTGDMYDYEYDYISTTAPWSDETIYEVVVNEGVTSIGDYAFTDELFLSEVSLPDSLIEIGRGAFEYTFIESIYIPKGVTTIYLNTFYCCVCLTDFEVDPQNESFCDIDGVLFGKDKEVLCIYPAGRTDAEYTIPEGTKAVLTYTFYFTTEPDLKRIYFPDSIIRMDENSLYCAREDLTVYGKSGSAVEEYAAENNIAFISTNAAEITAFNVDSVSGLGLASITAVNVPNTAAVFIAAYTGNRLCELQKITLENDSARAIFTADEIEKYKAFIWDASTMKQLCDSKTYEVK